jgi:hypothetical protein
MSLLSQCFGPVVTYAINNWPTIFEFAQAWLLVYAQIIVIDFAKVFGAKHGAVFTQGAAFELLRFVYVQIPNMVAHVIMGFALLIKLKLLWLYGFGVPVTINQPTGLGILLNQTLEFMNSYVARFSDSTASFYSAISNWSSDGEGPSGSGPSIDWSLVGRIGLVV